jgi:ATP-dependent exoDNAse (exonuclease V) alpha subunit
MAIGIKRVQFPIKLVYALTIYKPQGQTLDKIGLYLPTPVFSHGQLYVAFSRTRGFENIKVLIAQQNNEQGRMQNLNVIYTKNIVYHEVLQR